MSQDGKKPEACRLIEILAAELIGDELERLAAGVDRLVDQDTQAPCTPYADALQ